MPLPRVQPQAQQARAYVPPRLPSPRDAAPKSRDAAPKLIARGQSDDIPPAVRIPTPEELGVGTARLVAGDEAVDWTMVERRLDAAGATGYQVEKTTSGYRFTCQLPSGVVTGRGASKGEAVRGALAQLAR